MKKNTRPDWYRDAADWLGDNAPEYEAVLYNMGEPVEDPNIPTAQVSLNRDKTDTILTVNPDFVEGMEPENVAAVLMHEAVHLLKRHLSELQDTENNGMTNRKGLVISHEVIVNDYIDFLGFRLPDTEMPDGTVIPARESFIFGPENVGTMTIGMSTRQVYDMLELPDEDEQQGDGGGESQSGEGDGQGQDGGDPINGQACGHGHGDQDGDADIEKVFASKVAADPDADGSVDTLLDGFSDEELDQEPDEVDPDAEPGKLAGTGFDEREAEILAEQYGTTVEWMRLLNAVSPDFLKKEGPMRPKQTRADWTRKNLRASSLPRAMKLPARKHNRGEIEKGPRGRKPAIVIALDTSGSIPDYMQDRMITMIDSVPEELIEVRACTFSTRYVPFQGKGSRVASGGTAFDAVSEFIDSLDDEPNNVIVMTDGAAQYDYRRPSQDDLDNKYTWILFDRYDNMGEYNVRNETVRYLDEFFPSAVLEEDRQRYGRRGWW